MDARLHSRLERGHRAPGLGEPLGQVDFELGDLMRHRSDPGHDVAGQQTQGELVRVVENDDVVRGQAERRGGRHGGGHRTRDLGRLHR